MRDAIIIGTGSYLPDNIITNDDMANLVETNDEWIFSRTGIKERRISVTENTSDFAFAAAQKAIQNAGIKVDELDLIICATITPDSFMPSVACMIQDRLGAKNAAAFDLTAACTGLIYAIAVANSFIQSGMYRNVLVVGAETLSKALDWNDRATCVLFGDGAGAVVITASEHDTSKHNGVQSVILTSDGGKGEHLSLPALPICNPFVKEPQLDKWPVITMNGQEVFKFAVRSITDLVRQILDKAQITENDIKYIVTHQANQRIIEQAAKALGIPLDKFFVNIDKYANTSAATIGIALDEMVQRQMLKPGDLIILVGFGGGMTSGAVLVKWY